MLVALVPAVAAALLVTAALTPPPPLAPVADRVLDIRPAVQARALRTVSFRGRSVALGQGSLETATRAFTLKHTDVVADVSGFVSSVTVTQEFENPFTEPVEAVYVFPLPEDAAVNAMVLTAGNRVTRATIQKRADARRHYEEAKREGRIAALLDQERPNVFTQSVANLLPGERVKVTLTYVAPLRYDDGEYLFNFPMVVGPRFMPGKALPGESQGSGTSIDSDRVLDASRISPPAERTGRDIEVKLRIEAGSPIEGMWSASHRITAGRATGSSAEVSLWRGDRIPNKDFIVRWKVAGADRRAAMIATGGESGTFALMVVPPSAEVKAEIVPKEMVFVIDTSCSMNGPPLAAAKRAMTSAMEQMNPADTFMLIDFADVASSFYDKPLLATAQNVNRALSYLAALPAAGGTNQLSGLSRALDLAEDRERLRMVLLMTDGFIGNESEILAATEAKLGKARIFGFGIGSSVNHFLLSRMSEIGRGFYQYVRPDEDPEPAIERFVRRIDRPLLTDIEVDWGRLQVRDVLPRKVPDLFDAEPLVLVGRNLQPGRAVVTVKGKVRGVAVESKIEVTVPEQASGSQALTSLWARARIEELDRQQHGAEKAEVVEQITTLGLEHHLVTAYTSFVAVGDVVTQPGANKVSTEPTQAPALTTPRLPPRGTPPASNVEPLPTEASGEEKVDEDSFDEAFGSPDFKKPADDRRRKAVDVPPRPGNASGIKESLGQSDVFEVVSSNKPALAKCVEQQHKREPGLTGKIVFRWTITPAGKVTLVSVASEEFKDTYIAKCLGALIKTWTFPKHKVAGDPILFPFKF